MAETDGIKASDAIVVVIAATNRLDAIDKAMRSRFAETLDITLPSTGNRARIVSALLEGKPVEGDIRRVSEKLAEYTDGLAVGISRR
ncbi:MAG: AAA family ATPase [Candidatus Cybelea sp.]